MWGRILFRGKDINLAQLLLPTREKHFVPSLSSTTCGNRQIYVSHHRYGYKFPGLAFYEYHLEFSACAAYYREHHQCLIDWGSLDDRLLTQVVAGSSLCSAFDHEVNFCHLAAESDAQPNASSQSHLSAHRICYHYNSERGCNKKHCQFRHACNVCQITGHPEVKCPKKKDNKFHKNNWLQEQVTSPVNSFELERELANHRDFDKEKTLFISAVQHL